MGTYRIVRVYKGKFHPKDGLVSKIIKEGLSLEEAQAHCNDPSTREEGVWFDSYVEEGKKPLNRTSFMERLFELQTLEGARQ